MGIDFTKIDSASAGNVRFGAPGGEVAGKANRARFAEKLQGGQSGQSSDATSSAMASSKDETIKAIPKDEEIIDHEEGTRDVSENEKEKKPWKNEMP